MYEKFKGEIVEVGLDHHRLRGTLMDVFNHYIVLLIVEPNTGTMEEAIINIKKVNYITCRVTKKEKSSKRAKTSS